jgi:hypothetical protein
VVFGAMPYVMVVFVVDIGGIIDPITPLNEFDVRFKAMVIKLTSKL